MNTYLAIITTLLVVTQIIRVTQNAIHLHRQNAEIKRAIKWFEERDVSERDFDVQRECFYLLRDYLKEKEGKDDE